MSCPSGSLVGVLREELRMDVRDVWLHRLLPAYLWKPCEGKRQLQEREVSAGGAGWQFRTDSRRFPCAGKGSSHRVLKRMGRAAPLEAPLFEMLPGRGIRWTLH